MDQYITEYLSYNLFCHPDRRGWDGVRNRAHYQNVNETVCFPNFRARLYQLFKISMTRALLFLDALCRKNMWKLMQHYFIPCETNFNYIYPALLKLRDFNTVQKIYAGWARRNPTTRNMWGDRTSSKSIYASSNPKTAALFILNQGYVNINISIDCHNENFIEYQLYRNDNILEIMWHLYQQDYSHDANSLLGKLLDTIASYPKCISNMQIKMVELLMIKCRKTLSEHIGRIERMLPELYKKYKLMMKNDVVNSMIKKRYNLDVKIERALSGYGDFGNEPLNIAASGHYHRIMFRDCQIYCPKIFANIVNNNLSWIAFTSVVLGELRIEFRRDCNESNSRSSKHFCKCLPNPKKQLGITLIWKQRVKGTNAGIITERPALVKSQLFIDIELGDGGIVMTIEQII